MEADSSLRLTAPDYDCDALAGQDVVAAVPIDARAGVEVQLRHNGEESVAGKWGIVRHKLAVGEVVERHCLTGESFVRIQAAEEVGSESCACTFAYNYPGICRALALAVVAGALTMKSLQ